MLGRGDFDLRYLGISARRPVIARACMYVYDENVMQRSRNHVRRSHDRIAGTRHRAVVFLLYGCHATVGHHQPARVNVQIAIGNATRTFLLLASRPVASAMKLPPVACDLEIAARGCSFIFLFHRSADPCFHVTFERVSCSRVCRSENRSRKALEKYGLHGIYRARLIGRLR